MGDQQATCGAAQGQGTGQPPPLTIAVEGSAGQTLTLTAVTSYAADGDPGNTSLSLQLPVR